MCEQDESKGIGFVWEGGLKVYEQGKGVDLGG